MTRPHLFKNLAKIALAAAMIGSIGQNASAEKTASPTLVNCTKNTLTAKVGTFRRDLLVRGNGTYEIAPNARQVLKNLPVTNLFDVQILFTDQIHNDPESYIAIDPKKDHAVVEHVSKGFNPFRYRLKPLKDGKCPNS